MAWHRPTVSVTSDINVTPLVDVMLVLLIIFMVITPLMGHSVPVKLAQAVNPVMLPDADKDDAVIVAISHDGHQYLGNDMMSTDEITSKVRDLISNRLDKIVYVKADAIAHFQAVAAVVDAIRDAGVDNIAIETEKIDRQNLPPAAAGGQ
ncbi:MAG TPA: biopolymer transporter ExbD [Terriglobales bacterium]|jgi:biopolymer transport protein ExbD/biopolymer transport protein TolR